jgi:hypothetical protein
VDLGLVWLSGRLAAPGEPDYDPVQAEVNPPMYLLVYGDVARLEQFNAQPA